ncbi:hypothetical protein FNV43_RR12477 [Rhamnella rubrinervis]|uniref:Glycosyl transferase family 1 domain-containing protein n=1 Tax=Rhamnella rubrinervis TaxID=2594499 RepID=A0A8K0H7Y3_9ROSA|nr:hypothetical protein FNV43_RR12477 [Rhamnella rubrinervis]
MVKQNNAWMGMQTKRKSRDAEIHSEDRLRSVAANPLQFMKSKLVLLVSHELSLSGGPLLLMELAFLLRGVGAEVVWITNQKPAEPDEVMYSLEHKMLDRGVQVYNAKGQKVIDTALEADLVILNTAVAGKWLDAVLKENVPRILPKVLWWIHEMRGIILKWSAMIDSHTTAEYWKNRTQERLRIEMPKTHVVHLGNSKELMEVAEDSVSRRVLREHHASANCTGVSRGKGQDLFLRSFYESLQMIQDKKLQVPSMHALAVGSDMNAQTKTLRRGECFGRITIEAMAFQLPVLGTAAGGTTEIVVDGTTGFLHPVGKEGVSPLAKNIVKLATHVERRLTMGKKGYELVKDRFLEHHMAHRIALVLKDVLENAKSHANS